jgi:hypothetical protein
MKIYTLTEVEMTQTDFNKWLELSFDDGSIAVVEMPQISGFHSHIPPGAFRKIYEAAEKIHGFKKVRGVEQFIGLVFSEQDLQKLKIKIERAI